MELEVGYLNKTSTISPVTLAFEYTGLNNEGSEIILPSFFVFNKKNGKF
jgi:hypothetical protein